VQSPKAPLSEHEVSGLRGGAAAICNLPLSISITPSLSLKHSLTLSRTLSLSKPQSLSFSLNHSLSTREPDADCEL
jgi:hypothetical protein